MTCPRCKGWMSRRLELCMDPENHNYTKSVLYLVCFYCGEYLDPVVAQNRVSGPAEETPTEMEFYEKGKAATGAKAHRRYIR